MSRLVVGPFSRVEGDLEVALELEGGVIREAFVRAQMFRGFERILAGKAPLDALVLVPRICGICSAAQSAAAARALAAAAGVAPPPNGLRAERLVIACENLADHLTHFYLSFAPDLARDAYRARPWHARAAARLRAVRGTAAAEALAARARFLELMGTLAGKWPHTLALQPGGSSRPVTAAEKLRLQLLVRELRAFLERTFLGGALEPFAALDGPAALDAWAAAPGGGDLRLVLEAARDLGLDRVGRGPDAYLSTGGYRDEAGGFLLAPGLLLDGALRPADLAEVREDVACAHLAGDAPLHPSRGETAAAPDKAGAYTYCKAPRLGGRAVEVGALARLAVAGHPLARALAAGGGSVLARVVARALELAVVTGELTRWVAALEPGAPFHRPAPLPADAEAVGTVEAARGALGHWIALAGGKIARWQVVAPTTWNFSPRDRDGRPGPLEQALVGIEAASEEGAVMVQHVVRSFDPCMVCTVH